jgi:sugar phosphate isomerase/epimerase
MKMTRRHFLASSASIASGVALSSCSEPEKPAAEIPIEPDAPIKISLAQWSLHRTIREGKLANLDWPTYTIDNFGIDALEWVNQFFSEQKGKLGLQPLGGGHIAKMKERCDSLGMKSLLIMCDGVGQIGDPDKAKRTNAIEGHYAWLDAAKELGCHSIRVNSGSNPKLAPEEQAKLCVDGLRRLCEHAAPMGLNVIVENHGGLSSHGGWLAGVLKDVGLDNCGSLPDFGNFYVLKNRGDADQYETQKTLYKHVEGLTEDEFGLGYDRYQGTKELMPFAKGVSAKSHSFNAAGDEAHTDFGSMMQIIEETGYEGYLGIEYEGNELSEIDGIKATIALLNREIEKVWPTPETPGSISS